MKGIIYSAITGGYDELRPPLFKNKDWLYILLTDRVVDAPKEFDHVIEIPCSPQDSLLAQRKEKIIGDLISEFVEINFSESKNGMKTFYYDGKLQQTSDISPFANLLTKHVDLVIRRHPWRNCFYEEAQEVKRLNKADPNAVDLQMEYYSKQLNIPKGIGLVDAAILIRWADQSDYQRNFYNKWWAEFSTRAHRDQLSFNAVAWNHPLRIRYYIDYNDFFSRYKHN